MRQTWVSQGGCTGGWSARTQSTGVAVVSIASTECEGILIPSCSVRLVAAACADGEVGQMKFTLHLHNSRQSACRFRFGKAVVDFCDLLVCIASSFARVHMESYGLQCARSLASAQRRVFHAGDVGSVHWLPSAAAHLRFRPCTALSLSPFVLPVGAVRIPAPLCGLHRSTTCLTRATRTGCTMG